MDLYDSIGKGYRRLRRPDPRIAARILSALDGCNTVVNVGAGTGSYEPDDRFVVAVEPSIVMIEQRPGDASPVVRSLAAALPFKDGSLDASLAVLTVHHWTHQDTGLRELRRVARRRVVMLTWDPAWTGFWLKEYFPRIDEIDRKIFPSMDALERALGPIVSEVVPIPHDCTDGFLGAYWRRPRAYLDAGIRAGISSFSRIGDTATGLRALERDLESNEWHRRYAHLLDETAIDLGYRLVTTAT